MRVVKLVVGAILVPEGKFYVYVYRDPRPKSGFAPVYVGKARRYKKSAPREYVHWLNGSHNTPFNRFLQMLRDSKFEPIIEIVATFDDEKEAFANERALIERFGRRCIGSGSLFNLSEGGEGQSGVIFSDERRKRMSEAALRRPKRPPPSAETIEKRASKMRGKPRPKEHMAAALATRRGARPSPETIARMQKSHLGYVPTEKTKKRLSVSIKASWDRLGAEERRERLTSGVLSKNRRGAAAQPKGD